MSEDREVLLHTRNFTDISDLYRYKFLVRSTRSFYLNPMGRWIERRSICLTWRSLPAVICVQRQKCPPCPTFFANTVCGIIHVFQIVNLCSNIKKSVWSRAMAGRFWCFLFIFVKIKEKRWAAGFKRRRQYLRTYLLFLYGLSISFSNL